MWIHNIAIDMRCNDWCHPSDLGHPWRTEISNNRRCNDPQSLAGEHIESSQGAQDVCAKVWRLVQWRSNNPWCLRGVWSVSVSGTAGVEVLRYTLDNMGRVSEIAFFSQDQSIFRSHLPSCWQVEVAEVAVQTDNVNLQDLRLMVPEKVVEVETDERRQIIKYIPIVALADVEFLDATTWWLIPLSKWVITPIISGLSLLIPFITGVITHLLSGMSHQVEYVSSGYVT